MLKRGMPVERIVTVTMTGAELAALMETLDLAIRAAKKLAVDYGPLSAAHDARLEHLEKLRARLSAIPPQA